MERYLKRPGGPAAKTLTEPVSGTACKPSNSNKKRKPVSKESTIAAWGIDWLGVERGSQGAGPGNLAIFCKACREYEFW